MSSEKKKKSRHSSFFKTNIISLYDFISTIKSDDVPCDVMCARPSPLVVGKYGCYPVIIHDLYF